MPKFEDYIDELNALLKASEKKWGLDLGFIDYGDVCQIIRVHIYNKFHLWKPERGKFKGWAARIVTNQIINLKQRLINRFRSPCFNCPYNQGGNQCARNISGRQNEECELFAKWEKRKKAGYEIISARSIDETFEDDDDPRFQPAGGEVDIAGATTKLHEIMLTLLEGNLKKFYQLKYIDGHNDEVVAFAFGFTTCEAGRIPGYRQMYNLDSQIKKKVHFVLDNYDIF